VKNYGFYLLTKVAIERFVMLGISDFVNDQNQEKPRNDSAELMALNAFPIAGFQPGSLP